MLHKCVAAVHQQASGHVSREWREEGEPEEVKSHLMDLFKEISLLLGGYALWEGGVMSHT